jgi:hypothetical protein
MFDAASLVPAFYSGKPSFLRNTLGIQDGCAKNFGLRSGRFMARLTKDAHLLDRRRGQDGHPCGGRSGNNGSGERCRGTPSRPGGAFGSRPPLARTRTAPARCGRSERGVPERAARGITAPGKRKAELVSAARSLCGSHPPLERRAFAGNFQ